METKPSTRVLVPKHWFFFSKSNLSPDTVIFKNILIIDITLQDINHAFQKFHFSLFEIRYTFIHRCLPWFGVWDNPRQPLYLILSIQYGNGVRNDSRWTFQTRFPSLPSLLMPLDLPVFVVFVHMLILCHI